jgi:hypothetical protein
MKKAEADVERRLFDLQILMDDCVARAELAAKGIGGLNDIFARVYDRLDKALEKFDQAQALKS